MNIPESEFDSLIIWNISARDSRHRPPLPGLPLSLLVLWIGGADDTHHSLATYDLALIATGLDRSLDLHSLTTLFTRRAEEPPAHRLSLFESIGYATAGQIVWGELHQHSIARQDFDEVHPNLAGDMRQDFMSCRKLYPKHRIGQRFRYFPLDLYRLFLRHMSSFRSPSRKEAPLIAFEP